MKPGDRVRISSDGPFKSLEGTLVRKIETLVDPGVNFGTQWVVDIPEQSHKTWTKNPDGWILWGHILEVIEVADPDDPEYEAAKQKWQKILQ